MPTEPKVATVTLKDGTNVPCRVHLKQPDVWEVVPYRPVHHSEFKRLNIDVIPAHSSVEMRFAEDPPWLQGH